MTDDTRTGLTVTDSPDNSRFEAWSGGRLAGFAEYRQRGDLTIFTHTEVDPEFEGRGVGTALARAALDDALARDATVRPSCPFIARWIARHPAYHHLTEDARRGGG